MEWETTRISAKSDIGLYTICVEGDDAWCVTHTYRGPDGQFRSDQLVESGAVTLSRAKALCLAEMSARKFAADLNAFDANGSPVDSEVMP